MSTALKVLVVGASGGTGREVVARLAAQGHTVTAFSRSADRPAREVDGIVTVNGDVTDAEQVDHAVAGQDAVVLTVGIAENPLEVRVGGPRRTPLDVRSRGTRTVVEAMRAHGVDRLVVQSAYGVGSTRSRLRLSDRLVFRTLLATQIADTELQEQVVRSSGLDWVLVQPVHLTDGPAQRPFTATDGQVRQWKVSRAAVAQVIVAAVDHRTVTDETVAVSGWGPPRRPRSVSWP